MDKSKEYSFSKEEKRLLDSQDNLRAQYSYVASLIHRDMYVFVNGVVKKRLGIGDDMEITYNLEDGKLKATPKKVEEAKK